MKFNFIKSLLCIFFVTSLFVVKTANATLIIGDILTDESGVEWRYVGNYDLILGPEFRNAIPVNGIEGALIALNLASDQVYAISTVTTFVDHLAWYDAFDNSVGIHKNNEDAQANVAGLDIYDAAGDISAYIHDRGVRLSDVFDPADSDEGLYLNYVFQATTIAEPSSLIMFFSAIFAFIVSRKRIFTKYK